MPEISIIVPVYNVEKYLSECIESILSQTYEDFELILVNDGSLDNSGEICNQYSQKDARVVVIHQLNQGQAAARNRGIKAARGTWIHFVDGDDMIHPEMLQHLIDGVKKYGAKISMCGAEEAEYPSLDFKKKKLKEFEAHDVNEAYIKYIYCNTKYRYWIVWGKLIYVDIVRKIPFTEGKVYEDNAIVCRWLYEAKTVVNTESDLYFYRVNLLGTTKSNFSIKKIDYLWALEEQLFFYNSLNYQVMQNEIYKLYMRNATHIYNKVLDELKNRKAAHYIHKKARSIYEQYGDCAELKREEYIYIFGVFHPFIIKIYWNLVALKSKLQNLFFKIIKKL